MRMLLRTIGLVLLVDVCFAEGLEVGKKLPEVVLKDKDGGKVSGEPWKSSEVQTKVASIFYVDPANKSLNEPVEKEYKKQQLPLESHQGIAIINMAAAEYMPNWIISGELAKKQREFPQVIYAKDYNKILVKAWGLKDKSVNVILLDRQGIVRYLSRGAIPENEFEGYFKLMWSLINESGAKAAGSASPVPDKSKSPK